MARGAHPLGFARRVIAPALVIAAAGSCRPPPAKQPPPETSPISVQGERGPTIDPYQGADRETALALHLGLAASCSSEALLAQITHGRSLPPDAVANTAAAIEQADGAGCAAMLAPDAVTLVAYFPGARVRGAPAKLEPLGAVAVSGGVLAGSTLR